MAFTFAFPSIFYPDFKYIAQNVLNNLWGVLFFKFIKYSSSYELYKHHCQVRFSNHTVIVNLSIVPISSLQSTHAQHLFCQGSVHTEKHLTCVIMLNSFSYEPPHWVTDVSKKYLSSGLLYWLTAKRTRHKYAALVYFLASDPDQLCSLQLFTDGLFPAFVSCGFPKMLPLNTPELR